MLTLVDLAIVVVLVLAGLGGWRLGLSGFGFRLAGLVVGVIAGLWVAGLVVGSRFAPVTHLLLDAGCVLVTGLVGAAVGGRLGRAVGHLLVRLHLLVPDRVAGAVARAATALTVCWLVAAVVVAAGPPRAMQAVRDSAVLGQMSRALPSPVEIASQLTRQLAPPSDLVALVPTPSGNAAMPTSAQVRDVATRAAAGVVKIKGRGCANAVEGSGFAAGGELVVTNAHVVTGTSALTVIDSHGRQSAVPVVVDPAADIAVLRVDGLHAKPLPLATAPAPNGSRAVVLGYPGDGALTASPASVLQRLPVVQNGIGTTGLQTRELYRLAAEVRPGNSGGPLLDLDARVVGVVNARSLASPDGGYALTLTPLRDDLSAAATVHQGVDTGPCEHRPHSEHGVGTQRP